METRSATESILMFANKDRKYYFASNENQGHSSARGLAYEIGEGVLCTVLMPFIVTLAIGKILWDGFFGGMTH